MPLNRHRAKRLVCCRGFDEHIAVRDELKSALDDFVHFAQTLRGDEKGESHDARKILFIERLYY